MNLRRPLVIAHRWAGLTVALFIIVAGITGSTLPFQEPLRRLCAPSLWRVTPPSGGHLLSGAELAERAQRATGGQPVQFPLDIDGRHAVSMFIFASAGQPALDYDQIIVDPYTGQVRAKMRFGALREFPRDLPDFLLSLHYGYFAGSWGEWTFGVAALIWLLDAFVALMLTFPKNSKPARRVGDELEGKTWFARWGRAFRIRRPARGFRLNFDLHRAGGLWLWPLALVFAWSAFGMNLSTLRDPVTASLGAQPGFSPPRLPSPESQPVLGYAAAASRGAELMSLEANARHFEVFFPTQLNYDAAAGVYRYSARTSLDVGQGGSTTVWLASSDGRQLGFVPPVGPSGIDHIDFWADALHQAEVGGLPYSIFVSAFGLMLSALTVTGIAIWMRKSSGRLIRARRSDEIALH